MYAFLRDGNRSSLAVANIANSVQAFHGTLDLGQYPTLSTGASEDLLFAFSNELSVVDASMAEDPRVIGTADVSTSGEVHAVGDLVAIDGVEWFDVSDPSRPAALGTSTLEPPRWFRLEEGRMYGAWGTDLRAYDITDPLAPQLLWQTSMPEGLDSLAIADRHLVVIRDYIWGVVFIDKVSGEILHEHPIGFFVRRVDAAGDLTVVTVEPQKMVMIDTSDGYDHVRSATIPIPYDASRLVLSGGRAAMTRFNVLFTVQICQ